MVESGVDINLGEDNGPKTGASIGGGDFDMEPSLSTLAQAEPMLGVSVKAEADSDKVEAEAGAHKTGWVYG